MCAVGAAVLCFAQVYSIGPTFVERVMCRIVEQVAEEICRLFQCVPKFSSTSAIQVSSLSRLCEVYGMIIIHICLLRLV